MAALLEVTLTMCVCKLGFGLLCLRAARGALSSVGLCCGCLLLFTDLAIAVFLALLWLADSWLVPLSVSADRVALRFVLFLTHTYGDVMLLIVPLVAMEMAFHLHWPQSRGMEREDGGGNSQKRGEEICAQGSASGTAAATEGAERRRRNVSPAGASAPAASAHAACVLSCLLAWCISGLRAERRCDQDWPGVELCLEGDAAGIGSLWRCLPSMLSAARPDPSQPCWSFAAAAVLLGLYGSLQLISFRPIGNHARPESDRASQEGSERCHTIADVRVQMQTAGADPASDGAPLQGRGRWLWSDDVRVPMQTASVDPASVGLLSEREHPPDTDVPMQTRPALRAAVNPAGGDTTQSLTVDTETTASRCCVPSAVTAQGSGRRQPARPHGNRCLSCQRAAFSTTGAEGAFRQMQNTQPPALGQAPQQRQTGPQIDSSCCSSRQTGPQTDSSSSRQTGPQTDSSSSSSSRQTGPQTDSSCSSSRQTGPQTDSSSCSSRQTGPQTDSSSSSRQTGPQTDSSSRQTGPQTDSSCRQTGPQTDSSSCSSRQTGPQQLCPRWWASPGDCPGPRGLLTVGLVWGVFTCLFPVALGFSVLLIRHTETLLLFGLKALMPSPSHHKHAEST